MDESMLETECKDALEKIYLRIKKDENLSSNEKYKLIEYLETLNQKIEREVFKLYEENNHLAVPKDDIKALVKKYIPYWESELSSDKINESIEKGTEYLIKTHRGKGWGNWGYYSGLLKDECKKDKSPIRIWNTGTTICALVEIGEPSDSKIITQSKRWLIEQKRNRDGGFPDLPQNYWHCFPQKFEVQSNVYETSCSMIALLEAGEKAHSPYIQESLDFLLKVQDRKYGAWGTIPKSSNPNEKEMDVGATSNAIIALIKAKINPNTESIQRAIKWLKYNQRENGGWCAKWKGYSGETSLLKTHDALSALLAAGSTNEQNVIKKGVNYLLTIQDFLDDENGSWGLGWPKDLDELGYTASATTATAVSILLKVCDNKNHLAIESGIRYLINTRDIENSWGLHTPCVITCLHRYRAHSKTNFIGILP